MKELRLTSPGVLLIAAVAMAGGIFLLDLFYLRPQVLQQQEAAMREQVVKIQQAGHLAMQLEQAELEKAAGRLSPSAAAQPADAVGLSALARASQLDLAMVVSPQGNVLACYQAPATTSGGETAIAAAAGPQALAKLGSSGRGLLKVGSSHFLVAAVANEQQPRVIVGRVVGDELLKRLGAAIGAEVEVVPSPSLPRSVLTEESPNLSSWLHDGDQTLAVAWMLHSVAGEPAGYIKCDVPVSQIQRQSSVVRRAILIILSLSVGLVTLVIIGTHVLVAGPVVRLLRRLQLLESGDARQLDLCRDLHGEPLVLARRLESAFVRLAHLSKTDQLTQLSNRRHFEEVLDAFYQQARRYNRPLSVMIIDVDFFKAVNDAGGHQAGDTMLKSISSCLEKVCRKADLPARWGGDEFAILLPETTSTDAAAVAERIREAAGDQPVQVRGTSMKITLSIGIADLNSGEIDSPERMIAFADRALYTAKEMGRDRVVQAHDLDALTWPDSAESSAKVDVLCRKLAGLDNQIKDLFLRAVEELVIILEQRDPYMAMHARNVQHYAVLVAKEMGLPDRMIKRVEIAAMLHDIGMIAMPDSILQNAGALNEQQMQVMRRHPLLSVRIMEGMEFLDQEIPAVRYHHERYDGTGYPEGLAGPQIPLTARVLSLADTFVAMTSPRAFRAAKPFDAVVQEIREASGKHFDPAVVDAFVSLATREGENLLKVPEERPRAQVRHEMLAAALREEPSGD